MVAGGGTLLSLPLSDNLQLQNKEGLNMRMPYGVMPLVNEVVEYLKDESGNVIVHGCAEDPPEKPGKLSEESNKNCKWIMVSGK